MTFVRRVAESWYEARLVPGFAGLVAIVATLAAVRIV
jgi:hypothetical protein